jgi:hypothetical protein
MKKDIKGYLSLIFGIYGLINAPPLSFIVSFFPLKEYFVGFLILGFIFGIFEKKKTKLQKIGLIISIIGIILTLIGIIWALFFMK